MSDKCVSVFAGNLRDEDELYDYTEFRFNEDAPDDDEYDGYDDPEEDISSDDLADDMPLSGIFQNKKRRK